MSFGRLFYYKGHDILTPVILPVNNHQIIIIKKKIINKNLKSFIHSSKKGVINKT